MIKIKLLIAAVALTTLGGCATRTGTAIMAGTLGMVIGSGMTQPSSVVLRENSVIVYGSCNYYYTYSERAACERGVQQRYNEQQRQRDNAAYRAGYGR
jgi:hypothetical protein